MGTLKMEKTHDLSINAVRFLASVADANNPKNEINGVFFDFKNGYAVATDSRRLVRFRMPIDKTGKMKDVIVPKKILQSFSGAHKDKMDKVTFSTIKEETVVRTDSGDFDFITKGLGGKYPDYFRIFPEKYDRIQRCRLDLSFIAVALGREDIAFDYRYLKEVEMYIKQPSGAIYVDVKTNGRDNPFCLELIEAGGAVAEYVIMPLQVTDGDVEEITCE